MTHSMTYPSDRHRTTESRTTESRTTGGLEAGGRFMRSVALGAALIPAALVPAAPAFAGSDVLIRQTAPSFAACVAVQDAMMRNLGVEPDALAVEMDTGGMLMRKYASSAADLLLSCNRVTDVLEVRRVTPGTMDKASEPSVVASGDTATL